MRIPEGWLVLYHGVAGTPTRSLIPQPDVHYRAGGLVLDAADVSRVVLRTRAPTDVFEVRGRIAAESGPAVIGEAAMSGALIVHISMA